MIDVVANRLLQLVHTSETAVANAGVSDFTKPPLDHVQPRTGGRDEMNMKARMTLQPTRDLRMRGGGVVVNNQMQIEIGGSLGFDLF